MKIGGPVLSLAVKAYLCLQLQSCSAKGEFIALFILVSPFFFLFSSEIQFDLIDCYGIF